MIIIFYFVNSYNLFTHISYLHMHNIWWVLQLYYAFALEGQSPLLQLVFFFSLMKNNIIKNQVNLYNIFYKQLFK